MGGKGVKAGDALVAVPEPAAECPIDLARFRPGPKTEVDKPF